MRTCANCGTEVDEEAAFCPSCGQPLAEVPPTPAAPPPPAPAWHPEDEDEAARGQPTAAWSSREPFDEPRSDAAGSLVPPIEPREEAPVQAPAPAPPPEPYDEPYDEPYRTAVEERPAPPPLPQASPGPPGPPPPGSPEARPAVERSAPAELPLSLPVTVSGWLVGGGALVGALALFADFRLFSNPVTFVLLVLLLGVAATVFLAPRMPAIPFLQLGVMVTIFAGLGVALDRVGFGSIVGIGSAILLLAMIAAATGVVIAETGRDRPWAGPGAG